MDIKRLENGINFAEIHGYKAIGDQRRADGQIIIGGEIGHFPDSPKEDICQPGEGMDAWQKRANEKFVREAADIYRVLSNNLPGGTLHQLLIEMLRGKSNLYVVQDIPDTTIKDIAELARDYVWGEPLRWEGYLDSKKPGILPLPADCVRWNALCQAVEKRYGPPPVEPESVLQEMFPYCLTCKERGPSHSGDYAKITAFLAQHPSPEHRVDPKSSSELNAE